MLLLDTGDALTGGGLLGDKTQGKAIIAGMNLMGYDAMTLGQKELALGLDVLRQRLAEAEFPILSANAIDADTDKLLAEPHITIQVGDYRIAIVGLTRSLDEDLPGVKVLPPEEVAPKAVTAAAAEADMVILLTDMSFKTAQALVVELPEVDLVVAARPSQLPPQAIRVPGTSALAVVAEQPVENHTGRRIGRLAVTLNGDGTLAQEQWTSVAMSPDIKDDPEMKALLKTFQ